MKIVFLTPGTGSYYCGACMRDNALARELMRLGHDVTIAPMYLPLTIDDTLLAGMENTPIFFGGINVYLQQKVGLFRKTPAIIDRLFNSAPLLRWAARHSHMTSAREHGEMTLEMLNLESSPFQKEWEKLMSWFEAVGKPDIVCLSNALLAGFAAVLKKRLGVPIVTFFQGEDLFLDGLPEPFRSKCWTTLAERLADSDVLLSPSRFYAEYIGPRLGLSGDAIEIVPNGIPLTGFSTAEAPASPNIGYLARMTRDKGLELFVEAFLVLSRDLGDRTTRASIAGACTTGDEPLVRQLKKRIAQAGLEPRVHWYPNISRERKIEFLRSLSLFSVPATYREAFGLYVIEAMACGVPVVQPESSAFPEIIAATGGGVCVPPQDPGALAQAWRDLLADSNRRADLGRAGRLGVEKHFSAGKMCEQFCQVADRLLRTAA